MVKLSKSTDSSVLVWLRFTSLSKKCGKHKVSWRLIEYDQETKKVIYVFPMSKVAKPNPAFIDDRGYRRPHQFHVILTSDPEFMSALENAAAIPIGVKVS